METVGLALVFSRVAGFSRSKTRRLMRRLPNNTSRVPNRMPEITISCIVFTPSILSVGVLNLFLLAFPATIARQSGSWHPQCHHAVVPSTTRAVSVPPARYLRVQQLAHLPRRRGPRCRLQQNRGRCARNCRLVRHRMLQLAAVRLPCSRSPRALRVEWSPLAARPGRPLQQPLHRSSPDLSHTLET